MPDHIPDATAKISVCGRYRYSLSRRIWVRAGAEVESWDFDPAENDRDADVLKLDLTLRVALSDRGGLRASLLSEERDANGARNNRTGEGWAVAIEMEMKVTKAGHLKPKRIDGKRRYRKHLLPTRGQGIRDLVFDGDDLLVLTGLSMACDCPAAVLRWRYAASRNRSAVHPPG